MKRISLYMIAFITSVLSYNTYCVEFTYGNLTPNEQYMLELVNRLRANPTAEAKRMNVDLNDGLPPGTISSKPLPPLSSNGLLYKAAIDHCKDMAANKYFGHDSLDGRSPWARIASAGYYTGIAENIAGSSDPYTAYSMFYIDYGVDSKGHRINMLSASSEVGLGLCDGGLYGGYSVQDFGISGNQPILLGVIYDDVNNDGIANVTEGLSGVSITANTNNFITTEAGGYGLKVNPGKLTVHYEHDVYGEVDKVVNVGYENVKVDVKRHEFKPLPLRNCSVMTDTSVKFDCVSYQGNIYNAVLDVVWKDTLYYKLQSASPSYIHGVCHSLADGVLTINCVSYNNVKYSAHFTDQSNGLFKLKDYLIK